MTAGDRFGMLVVREVLTGTEAGHPYGGRWARCRCDCGRRKLARAKHLLRGGVKSCASLRCTRKLWVPHVRACRYCGRVIAINGMTQHEAWHRRGGE